MFNRYLQSGTLILVLAVTAATDVLRAGSIDPESAQAAEPAHPLSDSKITWPIGIIDFYGLRQLSSETLRKQLTFKEGDLVPRGDHSHSFFEPSKQRLLKVPGVVGAHLDIICCTDGRPVAFVGIEEKNAPTLQFRAAPTGSIRLSPEMLKVGAEFGHLWDEAVSSGHTEEDDSEGHMLFFDPAARPIENRMIAIASSQLTLLRRVLRESADSEHRAMAAQLLGYTRNKQSVVPDLVYAMTDPAVDVRNDAMRALGVFTRATKLKPPKVPYEPFVALLNSPFWSDRNKSLIAIMELSGARDPILLKMLREEAMSSLTEMARWSDRSHAAPAFYILGNLAGLNQDEIFDDFWVKNDRERVISAAINHT